MLVGCFGFNDPLRQYFSLYRVVPQREGEREERIEESKNVQTTPTRTYCKRNRPLPYYHPNCRTPRHWKFTQDHRTTRPPPWKWDKKEEGVIIFQSLSYLFSSLCNIGMKSAVTRYLKCDLHCQTLYTNFTEEEKYLHLDGNHENKTIIPMSTDFSLITILLVSTSYS